ncbi:MAG: FliM/FliN family flagellar motor switch protein [Vulcanimicrobiota bacterium]
MSDDILNQDELDALFSNPEGDGSAEPEKENSQPEQASSGLVSQDDIDALLEGNMEEESSASKEEAPSDSGGVINQDEIDALLGGDDDSAEEPPANKALTDSDAGELISQDEIDQLLGVSSDESGAETREIPLEKTPPKPKMKISSTPPRESPSEGDSLLSQDDIDALINSINVDEPKPVAKEAETDKPKTSKPAFEKVSRKEIFDTLTSPSSHSFSHRYKLYDFRHPEKLSRDQVRKIKSYFESIPRYLTNYLAKILRSGVDVNLIEIDQRNYGEMFRGSASPNVIGIFSLGPGLPTGVVEYSIHQFYCILEKLMGGTGTSITPLRKLTDFEKYVVSDIFNNVLRFYQDVFNKLAPIDPQIEIIETDGQMIPKTLSEDEILVRKIYEIKFNGIAGYLTISVPYNFLGPHFGRFRRTREEFQTVDMDLTNVKLGANIKKLNIPVSVEFKKKRIPALDTIQLKQGGVIVLDHKVNENLNVKVNGKLKYFGKVGMKGKKMAVQITSTIQEEE